MVMGCACIFGALKQFINPLVVIVVLVFIIFGCCLVVLCDRVGGAEDASGYVMNEGNMSKTPAIPTHWIG
jgi:hypothetical protein